MEYKIQESILVNKSIEKIEKKTEIIIREINGKITETQSESIFWIYNYVFQTIKCKTYLISHEKNTEIVIMVDAEYIGLPGSKKIISDFKKALSLNSKIKFLSHIPIDSKEKEKTNNELIKTTSKKVKHYKEQSYSVNEIQQKTDPFAIVTFASGLGGFVILPILFIPIGYIASILSYYRLKENKELKGGGLRIFGAILTTINILWIMYQFKLGIFRN